MTRRYACALALLAGLMLTQLTVAAQAQTCLPIDSAMGLAADGAPNVALANAGLSEARANVKSARALFRPQLSAFGRTGLGDVGAVNGVVQNQIGLRASQRVIDFGDARRARRAADFQSEAESLSVLEERDRASLELGLVIIDRMEAAERLAAVRERAGYFERFRQSAERLIEVGGVTRSELANIAARRADAEVLALDFQFLIDEADSIIALDTGVSAPICPISDYFSPRLEAASNVDSARAVTAAIAANPGLKALDARARSAEEARKREARSRLPVIEVVAIGAYASQGQGSGLEFQDRIGVDVSVPLYAGSGLAAGRERAAARVQLVQAEIAVRRREIVQRIEIGLKRLQTLTAQSAGRRDISAFRRDGLTAAEREYEQGLRTLPELIEARLDYEQARLAQIASEAEIRRLILTLESLHALDFTEQGSN